MSSAQPTSESPVVLPSASGPRPCIQEIWIAGEPHLVFSGPEGTLTLNRAQARFLRSHHAYLEAFLATHDSTPPTPPTVMVKPLPSPQVARAPRRQGPRSRVNYGISRIDQPHKTHHGWYVRITRNGRTTQKFFADRRYESRDSALEAARRHRDALLASLDGAGSHGPAQG